jgi:hypothetical protein
MRLTSTGLGIGTSSPGAKLDVAGSTYIRGDSTDATFTSPGQLAIKRSSSDPVLSFHNNTGGQIGFIQMQNSGTCTIGVAVNQPLAFNTNGSERARFSAAGGFSLNTTSDPGVGAIYATGNITAFFSDKRLKTVSGKIENALDKVGKLSGVYYTFNDTAKSFGYDSDEEQVGVIAQEVEAVLPQIVKAAPFDLDENNNSKSGENYKTVQYDKLVPLLIEAINELQAKVKALEAK